MRDSFEKLIDDLEAAGAASANEYAPCAYFGAAPTRCRDASSGHQCPAFDAYTDPCNAVGEDPLGFRLCSSCGYESWADEDSVTPYCPNCGAKVVE